MPPGSADAAPPADAWRTTPFRVTLGSVELYLLPNGLPGLYDTSAAGAALVDEVGREEPGGQTVFLALGQPDAEPFLVVTVAYHPMAVPTDCGVLVAPETHRLFLAAGERLLCYDVLPNRPRRLWEDVAESGFWHGHQVGGVVLMAAELTFSAWDTAGRKLWRRFVEPPWSYRVHDGNVLLDVLGRTTTFPLHAGPT